MNGGEVEENGKMKCLEIGSQLKSKIENGQLQILNALRYHNHLIGEKKKEPAAKSAEQLLESDFRDAKQEWVHIKYKQRKLVRRLRQEYKAYQATVRNTTVNSAVKERKHHLSYAINRSRKQNLLPPRRISPIRSYENEPEVARSPSPLPGPAENHPTTPEETDQNSFLFYFRLTTHENFTEMQNKRAERKRRSTVNPQFLYGNKGWDFLGPLVKRKRSNFLAHPPSPPNTRGRKRQAIMKKSVSPPVSVTTNGNHSDKTIINNRVGGFIPLLPTTLKNLPPGLVIEPISPSANPDSQRCIICKQPGALSLCEHCTNGFHMSCHNRPFARTPKQCPKCLCAKIKEDQVLACSSNSSSSSTSCSSAMSVDSNPSPTPTEILEKLQLKRECQEKRVELMAELTQLQNRHSELTVVLKNQDEDKQRLTQINKSTEAKIDELIRFIENVKRIPVPEQVI